MARRDFLRLAVFLLSKPLDTALSNLELASWRAFFASSVFLAANRLWIFFRVFLRSSLTLIFLSRIFLSARNLFAAHFLCGMAIPFFRRLIFITYKESVVN